MTEFDFKTIDTVENRSYFLLIGIYEYNYPIVFSASIFNGCDKFERGQ